MHYLIYKNLFWSYAIQAKFEFDLDNPDDQRLFKIMNQAPDLVLVMSEFSQKLSEKIRWDGFSDADEKRDAYEEIMTLFLKMLSDDGINLDLLL